MHGQEVVVSGILEDHRRGSGRGVAVRGVGDQAHDIALLAAVCEKLADRIAEIAAAIETAEGTLVIRPALHQGRLSRGTLRRPTQEGSDGGSDPGDGMHATRELLDVNARVIDLD